MATLDDGQRVALLDDRPYVPPGMRHLRQRRKDVQPGERARGRQELPSSGRHAPTHLLEQLVLEPPPALVGAERLRLVLFELRGHVALGAGERLTSHVFGGHTRGVGVGDLDAVAEDAIEADSKARDAGPCPLPLLETGDPRPCLPGIADDPGEPLVPALADQPAVVKREGRLVLERRCQEVAEVVERCQLAERLRDRRRGDRRRDPTDLRERRQARAQADEVTRVGLAERRAAGQPLEVADPTQQRGKSCPLCRRFDQGADRGLARGDREGIE